MLASCCTPRFISREPLHRRSPTRLIFEIDMGKRLSVGVKNKGQSRLKRMMQLASMRARARAPWGLSGKVHVSPRPSDSVARLSEKVRAVRSGDETGTER